jgi:type IV secretion system protein VirB3
MGVPLTPFVLTVGGFVLLSVYFTFWFLVLLPIVIVVMREMVKTDDQIFHLLFLKARFRLPPYLSGSLRFWRSNSYSPIPFKIRKP